MTLSGVASAAGLALGYGLDRQFGDPRRWHPVAGFGRLVAAVERRRYADDRAAGVVVVSALVGGTVLAAAVLERTVIGAPAARLVTTAVATWAVLGGRSLEREAMIISGLLDRSDLTAARAQIGHLVGRDPSGLTADGLARACVESVAENTSDAVVAPLLWGAVAGLPGLLGYRAVNTLDAMVGHRSARYRNFGWAAARLDDLANWLPARLTAILTSASAPVIGGSPVRALLTSVRHGHRHPSPNAGVVEAAFAGALGVRLGGRNVYHGEVEDRGRLGDGPAPRPDDIDRATRLASTVSALALALSVALAVALRAAGRR